MLSDARPFMQIAPHIMIFPGLAIFLSVMAFNLMGDGLRDALGSFGKINNCSTRNCLKRNPKNNIISP
ncbi:Dipeptide transport system permease protein DppC (TC 3.A.1.5.2) [hydrothermal vent metagenome]|uniref:Dipeptide transport system permease protein DppC (TC 3.A.1.5.2) n=1 Tax=hydrothermal vent metagenome TaxID=652676 RepID=A0A3B0V108_9ZZZZ